MLKKELIQKLSARSHPLTQQDARVALEVILEAIASRLINGGRIEIRGFGSFSVTMRKPKIGRNPKTGQTVFVKAKPHIRFKYGAILGEKLK